MVPDTEKTKPFKQDNPISKIPLPFKYANERRDMKM
jgi:hypothetical protein